MFDDWIAVGRGVWREVATDRVMMIAAGLAFYGVFGLLPALAGAAVIYGAMLQEETLRRQFDALDDVLPEGTTDLLREFVTTVPEGLGFGIGLAVNLAIILWTVQRTASGVITALNVAYDVEEKRTRLRREAIALVISASGLVLLLLALALIAATPALDSLIGAPAAAVVRLARWPVLALVFGGVVGLLYAFGPCRADARWRWVGSGAATATILWLAGTYLFAVYIDHAGGYGRLYGSLAAVIVLMTWMFITALAVMIGAEVNAQLAEHFGAKPRSGLKDSFRRRQRGIG